MTAAGEQSTWPSRPASRRAAAAAAVARPHGQARRSRSPPVLFVLIVVWLTVTAPLSRSLQPIARAEPHHPLGRGRADRPARRDHRRAGRRHATCRPMSARPSSRSRTGASSAISASIPWGIAPGDVAQPARRPACARAAARSPSSSPRPASSRPDRTVDAQGAGGADRALAGGVAEQGGDPQPLSLQRLFRRQCLRPARRRPPLFQRRARGADPRRRRRCWPAWSTRRRGSRRPATSTARAGARAAGAAARWSRSATSPRRERDAARPARLRRGPRDDVPTGTYFADWVLPAGERAGRRRLWRAPGPDHARGRPPARSPSAPSAAPASAAPRRRWSRCGSTAGSSRWSAARIMRKARSTAPPRRAASPARRSSCSSISPPSAPAARRTRRSTTCRSGSATGSRAITAMPIAAAITAARRGRPCRAIRWRCRFPSGSAATMSSAPPATSASPRRCGPIRACALGSQQRHACSS